MNEEVIGAATVRERIMARAAELEPVKPSLARFLSLTARSMEEEDFSGLDPEAFETVLSHSYARLGHREENGHLINIWSPEDDGSAQFQIIDIFVGNMPFLVDSTLHAIRALGGTILRLAHPILHVKPGRSGAEVLLKPEPGSRAESFLHLHIAPIADEERRAALFAELDRTLSDVRQSVTGWRPMLERLRALVHHYREHPPASDDAGMTETLHFVGWLTDHNFTFLGMREYRVTGGGDALSLEPLPASGLGILADPEVKFLRAGTELVEMTPQHTAFLQSRESALITKANIRSRVHRRTYMDYVGIKLFDAAGELTGELRILGLFTSMSLNTPPSEIPVLRGKFVAVMRRAGYDPQSHAGKALTAALESYPREELFQISVPVLHEYAAIIAGLPDRPRVRVLPRIDRFDNFVSVLVYLPRERYSGEIRERIGDYLVKTYDGRLSAFYPNFLEGDLVRVQFIVGRDGGETPDPPRHQLEEEVSAIATSFADSLSAEAGPDANGVSAYFEAFPAGYQAQYSAREAVRDIGIFQGLGQSDNIAIRLTEALEDPGRFSLTFYHNASAIPLSARVPMLENFGFSVIDERTHSIYPADRRERFLHDMLVTPRDNGDAVDALNPDLLEQALLAVWEGRAENDGFNALTLCAALGWQDVAILRALGRYLKQVGVPFSQRYLWTALASHPQLAEQLVRLFHILHDPGFEGDREAGASDVNQAIETALEAVSSADEDTIIRHFRNLVEVSLRTNFFQRDAQGGPLPALAIKFDSARVNGLPEPRPYREIWVYAPDVEGIHLRGGPIARGGIRWSDRPEDFRTEVLGLVKAQMVKNAVIVPVGAKGGFFPKSMPAKPDRETFLAIGTAAYKTFIGALLDITDNLEGDTLVPPPDTVRRDGDDPYLVVAADKGTASFSDMANAIARSRDYWLDDAFASGGSAGYDHKKMGITARGGWESVKRHFREMNRDIQTEPFTVAGVGDMSGDVFGNGMLLSPVTRLVAAFDHRDIFIDPDPDPAASLAERRRLFEMPRSSWQDYDPKVITQGGGVFPRSAKTIDLPKSSRQLLGLGDGPLTPHQIMRAILKSQVDLIWFGGIGTYVRASDETDADADDRANDPIRITGKQLRAKVVGEGANLGVTQRGRIEFARTGGRINTDAIDNSAGVNSSDLEVNIKIALGNLVRSGAMSLDARNALLVEMTPEVAELCLKNNYLQPLALSLTERQGMNAFPDLVTFIQQLETEGHLNRAVEFLPDDATLTERALTGQAFARPELAILLAYAKNTLFTELLASPVPDDPYLATELFRYFPDTLKERHPDAIESHRLRREVIATVLSNAMINRGGPAFVHRMTTITNAAPADVAAAYATARDVFGLTTINAEIDALDGRIDGQTQLALYAEVQTLLVEQTLWFLRQADFSAGLSGLIDCYGSGVAEIRQSLSRLLPPFIAKSVADQAEGFAKGGAPEPLARRIAELSALNLASEIVFAAEKSGSTTLEAGEAFFALVEMFKLGRITEQGSRLSLPDKYDRMALDRALANFMRAQTGLTCNVLTAGNGPVSKRFAAWKAARPEEIARTVKAVTTLTEDELTVSRLSVAAGLLSDLVRNK